MDGQRLSGTIIIASLVMLFIGSGCGMNSSSPQGGSGIQIAELRIENLLASEVTDTTAVVNWTTSFSTLSSLTVSDQASLENPLYVHTPVGTSHQVQLDDLVASTNYYYKVNAARVATGDTTSQRGAPFTTAQDADLFDPTAPLISNIEVINITSQSATVLWTTDDRCYGGTNYGIETPLENYILELIDPPHTHLRSHSAQLIDLTHATHYQYTIKATNVASLQTTSNPLTFTTTSLPYVSFCPDLIAVLPGDTFDITVCINDVTDLGAVRVEITVDRTCIEIIQTPLEGAFWADPSRRGHLEFPEYDNIVGTALWEGTWEIEMDGDQTLGTWADGSGVIFTVKCRLKEDATASSVVFSDIQLRDYLRYPIDIDTPGSCTIDLAQ